MHGPAGIFWANLTPFSLKGAGCAAKDGKCAMSCDAEPCNQWLTVENATANNSSFLQDFSAVCFLTVRDIARMHTGGGNSPGR